MSRTRWVPFVLLALALLPPLAWGEEEQAPTADLSTPEAVKKALGDRDPAVRLAAARAAAGMPDEKLASALTPLLKDKETPVRDAALDALVARTDEKERRAAARVIAALVRPLEREPKAEDLALEKVLVPALHDLAQKESIEPLLADVHMEAPAEWIRARLRAVANVPCAEAVEALIDYGSRRRAGDGHRNAVREALKYAVGVDLTGDPDRWRAWWREAKGAFDFEAAAARREAERKAKEDREQRREERGKRREDREKPDKPDTPDEPAPPPGGEEPRDP